MKEKLTPRRLNSLPVTGKEYEIHHTAVPGLFVRVTAAGAKSYVVTWARGRKKTLGRVGIMTLAQAEEEALQYLTEARKHGEPLAVAQGRKGSASPTLRDFIDDTYLPWFKAHHRGHEKTTHTLSTCFEPIMSRRLVEVTGRDLEQIRTDWLKAGNKPSTANRKMGTLSGVFSRAVDWSYLEASPLDKVKALKVDTKGRIRYLSKDEAKALREALDAREERMRAERDSANQWRAERKRKPMVDLRAVTFTDHLKPMVILSLNTGLRRGELFNLRWPDVNLQAKTLTVAGEGTKTTETRHIPLNAEALATLKAWKKQSEAGGYVFPGQDGERMTDVKTAWLELLKNAGVEDFRWHDMRHDFASRLVMAGVPLNTVRDLLGHSDIKMTLRYAHLAPDSKAAAVELI
ncbi:site-specific integrase [Pseudomonas aeruginosa]|uniref:site-specific integrase n=1 Tax=Pseudomonas aeruginosa TaxID=287 RepID=UPI000F5288DD|nr:site-specific integrase [Pseudomonas aeruginosa]RPZ02160.1 integrase [Pseudomonas aeruginosa]WOA84054.1 site-specific integrase [Pseudomonas aeruginosa]